MGTYEACILSHSSLELLSSPKSQGGTPGLAVLSSCRRAARDMARAVILLYVFRNSRTEYRFYRHFNFLHLRSGSLLSCTETAGFRPDIKTLPFHLPFYTCNAFCILPVYFCPSGNRTLRRTVTILFYYLVTISTGTLKIFATFRIVSICLPVAAAK